jgi:hypothetical protein
VDLLATELRAEPTRLELRLELLNAVDDLAADRTEDELRDLLNEVHWMAAPVPPLRR